MTDGTARAIDQISFRVADQSAAEARAREGAVKDARAKADTLAAAAGVSIDGVAAITEGGIGPIPFPRPFERMAMSAKDAGTPIEAGENEVTASVTITYFLGTAKPR